MEVKYVGLQSPHRERLYGSLVSFSGPDDVQEVPDEIAEVMISNHPEYLAFSGKSTGLSSAVSVPAGPVDQEPGTVTTSTEILIGDEYVRMDKATKKQLARFALSTFNVELVESRTLKTLQGEVLALMSSEE